jgi:hypothetical protein
MAYSTTSSSFVLHRRTPMLGFSCAVFCHGQGPPGRRLACPCAPARSARFSVQRRRGTVGLDDRIYGLRLNQRSYPLRPIFANMRHSAPEDISLRIGRYKSFIINEYSRDKVNCIGPSISICSRIASLRRRRSSTSFLRPAGDGRIANSHAKSRNQRLNGPCCLI